MSKVSFFPFCIFQFNKIWLSVQLEAGVKWEDVEWRVCMQVCLCVWVHERARDLRMRMYAMCTHVCVRYVNTYVSLRLCLNLHLIEIKFNCPNFLFTRLFYIGVCFLWWECNEHFMDKINIVFQRILLFYTKLVGAIVSDAILECLPNA